MEEESEKMMGLKQAYAEIILNTAKEAAAKIMASERKARVYHHDLSSAKDEALRLLLRLKQTMEWKINEVEMKSHDQQIKIDELEAQLQEAEDIVTNLRAELNETHMKLDALANNQKCAAANVMVKAVDENGFNEKSQPMIREAVFASQEERVNNGALGNSSTTRTLEVYSYSGEPEVPSIIIKRKEPESYQNRCTQRIRACDGNLLKDHLQKVKEPREDKEGVGICVKAAAVGETECVEEETPINIKEAEDEETLDLMQYLKLLRTRRTEASRCKRNNASSLEHVSHMFKEECLDLTTSHDMHESCNEDTGRQSNSPSTAASDISEMGTLPANGFGFQIDKKLTGIHAEYVNKDKEQSLSKKSLEDIGSNTGLEMKISSSLNLDAKLLDTCDGLSSAQKDKILKHTFQRKRKKDSVVSDDRYLLHEYNPIRKEIVTKQNGNVEPVKSTAVTESLQVGKRIAQGLFQLREKRKQTNRLLRGLN